MKQESRFLSARGRTPQPSEYFHGDDGQGLGASHQTGWTALAANVLERVAAVRPAR